MKTKQESVSTHWKLIGNQGYKYLNIFESQNNVSSRIAWNWNVTKKSKMQYKIIIVLHKVDCK